MIDDLKIIKKKYGEKMSRFCRDSFPSILEKDGLLSKLLLDNFEPNHSLYEDIVQDKKIDSFKDYIYSLLEYKEKESLIENKTPEELMNIAGYDLYECKTEEDIQRFRKYYDIGEELCTFKGGRLKNCFVFFAIKKDIDNIKREDFKNPDRQDLYGTSVISIQFSKDRNHTLSIKNRYNHTVNNPDATFGNSLDNIIPGLTESFAKFYGLIQTYPNSGFEIRNYVKAYGKYYRYNYEIQNKYYCSNNIVIDNFKVIRLPKEKYLIFDYFILDLVKKTLTVYNLDTFDAFPESIGDIDKIDIKNSDKNKIISITPKDGKIITIELDKNNAIYKLDNPNVKKIGDCFLYFNNTLKEISLAKVEIIGNMFLNSDEILSSIYIPKVEQIGNKFLATNSSILELRLENLRKIGDDFLYNNYNLKIIELPKVEKILNNFIRHNAIITSIDFPNLVSVGEFFLADNKKITKLELKKLETVGSNFMRYNNSLKELNLPNLNFVGYSFLEFNRALTTLKLPQLKVADHNFLTNNKDICLIEMPSLAIVYNNFLSSNLFLKEICLPKLQEVGDCFLMENNVLERAYLPFLKKVGSQFLFQNTSLKELVLSSDFKFLKDNSLMNSSNFKLYDDKLIMKKILK